MKNTSVLSVSLAMLILCPVTGWALYRVLWKTMSVDQDIAVISGIICAIVHAATGVAGAFVSIARMIPSPFKE